MCPEKQCDVISLASWQLFYGWYYSCHEYILNWLFVHSHSWTQTLCIKQGVSDLHLPRFCSCHDISPQFSSVQAGRQEIWVRCQKFVCSSCFKFDGAEYCWWLLIQPFHLITKWLWIIYCFSRIRISNLIIK